MNQKKNLLTLLKEKYKIDLLIAYYLILFEELKVERDINPIVLINNFELIV